MGFILFCHFNYILCVLALSIHIIKMNILPSPKSTGIMFSFFVKLKYERNDFLDDLINFYFKILF